jgi:hypothetical protein
MLQRGAARMACFPPLSLMKGERTEVRGFALHALTYEPGPDPVVFKSNPHPPPLPSEGRGDLGTQQRRVVKAARWHFPCPDKSARYNGSA